MYLIASLVAIASYLVGSINPSIILSKSIYGKDIRESGSGNAGTTNMLRTHGKGMAIATLVCDILKGAIMVILASWLDNIYAAQNPDFSDFENIYLVGSLKYIAAIFAVIGHDFPIYFGFRGGKGVATSLGVVLALDWPVGIIMMVAAITIMAVSRYVSLGSVTAGGVYPFVLFVYLLSTGETLESNVTYIVMSFALALLVIGKHHANIARLLKGTENKLFAKKAEEQEEPLSEEEAE